MRRDFVGTYLCVLETVDAAAMPERSLEGQNPVVDVALGHVHGKAIIHGRAPAR